MASDAENSASMSEKVSQLTIKSDNHGDCNHGNDQTCIGDDEFSKNWGFSVSELYKLGINFYREKEGKALQLTYQEKLKLVAYTKQVVSGPYNQSLASPVGMLDVIGNDRRQAWQSLGDMCKEDAMNEFCTLLDKKCVLFRPYVEAHKRDLEEKERLRKEEELRQLQEEEEERERLRLEEEAQMRAREELKRQELHKQRIMEALNKQTESQFQSYAEQQFPNNKDQQLTLIKQLQEEHYQQYMQQVYQQQLQQQQQQQQTPTEKTLPNNLHNAGQQNGIGEETTHEETQVSVANMWTRKDTVEFKATLKKDKDAVIRVGHGETVTVRVPTHEEGTCLFWEFATDSYDLGFGLYFEWTDPPNNTVSVHVSESDEEEEDEDEETGDRKDDVEKGSATSTPKGPPVDEIIPVYRRDCHEEVYAGSHVYPGRGIYLLKFDNSYSLWRSKTLYYRVYYTR